MASHPPDLLGQLRAARERIDAILTRPGNAPVALSIASAALDSIARMEGLIDSGRMGAMDLAAIANVLTAAQSAATALETANATSTTQAAEQLASASAASRSEVRSIMSGMRDFDDQLRFGPGDSEEAYRAREAERCAYIETQQAKNTPPGNLNAASAAVGQMADAKAHGAGGPEFDKRWGELVATTEKLRDAAKANGVSTEEFDRRLSDDLRHIMKSKGLSDAEIDARFAAQPDPLEAAKAYVSGKSDAQTILNAASQASKPTETPAVVAAPSPPDAGMDAAIARLQAAGVTAAEPTAEQSFNHGVTARARVAETGRSAST